MILSPRKKGSIQKKKKKKQYQNFSYGGISGGSGGGDHVVGPGGNVSPHEHDHQQDDGDEGDDDGDVLADGDDTYVEDLDIYSGCSMYSSNHSFNRRRRGSGIDSDENGSFVYHEHYTDFNPQTTRGSHRENIFTTKKSITRASLGHFANNNSGKFRNSLRLSTKNANNNDSSPRSPPNHNKSTAPNSNHDMNNNTNESGAAAVIGGSSHGSSGNRLGKTHNSSTDDHLQNNNNNSKDFLFDNTNNSFGNNNNNTSSTFHGNHHNTSQRNSTVRYSSHHHHNEDVDPEVMAAYYRDLDDGEEIELNFQPHPDSLRQIPYLELGLLVVTVIVGVCVAHFIVHGDFVECGTAEFWGLLFAGVLVDVFISFMYRLKLARIAKRVSLGVTHKVQLPCVWNYKNSVVLPLLSSAAGVASSLFGLGGGTIVGPLLLEAGVAPERVSASGSVLTGFLALQSMLVAMGGDSVVPSWDYIATFAAIGALSTVFGRFFALREIKRRKATWMIIMFLAVILILTLLSTVGYGAYNLAQLMNYGAGAGTMGRICPASKQKTSTSN